MSSSVAISLSSPVVEAHLILQFAKEVAELFNPDQIVLFGSYAYGEPTADSDVDLLVVIPHRGPGHRMATRIRLATAVNFPMDLLVRSAAELRRGVSQQDWFIVEVVEKGIVLHDRSDPSVGAKGRSRLRRRFASSAVS